MSDQPERFFASEIIREKIFLQYNKEIPYVSQVEWMQFFVYDISESYVKLNCTSQQVSFFHVFLPVRLTFSDMLRGDFVEVEIVVEKESQKAIMIGKV